MYHCRFTPMALRAALELDIFTILAEGPMTSNELAGALACGGHRLELLLYALASAEFLYVDDGRFSNAPVADYYLVRGKPSYAGGIWKNWTTFWRAMLATADTIRSGQPTSKLDFSAMSEEERASLYSGFHANNIRSGKMLADAVDWSQYQNFVDIGGGSGGLSIALCQALPTLNATVMELPSIAPTTRKYIAEAEFNDCIVVEEANILEEALPKGHDAAVAKNLFQILSEDQCHIVARNIGAGLAPGASLFINGFICDDDRMGPEISVGYNLIFLNMYDEGTAYTEAQYQEWLTDAGFSNCHRWGVTSDKSYAVDACPPLPRFGRSRFWPPVEQLPADVQARLYR